MDAAVDFIGTDEAIDVSLALVADCARIATIVAIEHARQAGIQYLGGLPEQDLHGLRVRMASRTKLAALAQANVLDVMEPDAIPLLRAADAHRLVAKGGIRLALVP